MNRYLKHFTPAQLADKSLDAVRKLECERCCQVFNPLQRKHIRCDPEALHPYGLLVVCTKCAAVLDSDEEGE